VTLGAGWPRDYPRQQGAFDRVDHRKSRSGGRITQCRPHASTLQHLSNGGNMTRLVLLCAWLCATALIATANPAQAGVPVSYVSNTGSDSGNCATPATACASFVYALSQTISYGEIDCVNNGSYGTTALVITQSVTIDCAGGANVMLSAEESPAGNGSIVINGQGIVVRLRHLSFNRVGGGSAGIDAVNLAALYVENCVISNVTNALNQNLGSYLGIKFEPTSNAQLSVSNSIISDNGVSGSGLTGGIYIVPGSGATATVSINRSEIEGNVFGIVGDGTSGGIVKGTISNSVVSGNAEDGIATIGSGSAVWFLVDQTEVSGNTFGLAAGGSGAEILASGSSVFGNSTGLHTSSGGGLYSYGNNKVNGNTSNGAFTGTIGLQ
jgi:hypothetical protein